MGKRSVPVGFSGREFVVSLLALGFPVFVFGLFLFGASGILTNKHLLELLLHDYQEVGRNFNGY